MADRKVHRRRLLGLSGAAAVAALSGCASFAQDASSGQPKTPESTPTRTPGETTQSKTTTTNATADDETADGGTDAELRPQTIDEPQFDVSAAPLTTKSPKPRYPTLGTADTTLTIYGNWKCPYTQEFVREQLGGLVEEFVATGDVAIEYRNVAYAGGEPHLGADAPRAAEAGLAVWDIDPQSFWTYFAYVFANQPQERYEWATTDTLVRLAERAGVDGTDQIQRAIRARTYAQSVQLSAKQATEIGITTVPRVVYDGETTAPTVNPDKTRRQFEEAASSGSFSGGDADGNTTTTSEFGSGDDGNTTTTSEFGSGDDGNTTTTSEFGSDDSDDSDDDFSQ
ncbi:DsbA family protein (plasmid) [Haloferax sp. S1W]|uniref:DsbA family protein n=1 Tax=Haloferax sp. S1W TaxID=3377110 RepID=UPI0037CC5181